MSIGVSTGEWVVDLTVRDSAVPQVEAVSTRLLHHADQQLAVTIDGEVVAAPATDAVLGRDIEISGADPVFTHRDAAELANALNAGALPVALTVG